MHNVVSRQRYYAGLSRITLTLSHLQTITQYLMQVQHARALALQLQGSGACGELREPEPPGIPAFWHPQGDEAVGVEHQTDPTQPLAPQQQPSPPAGSALEPCDSVMSAAELELAGRKPGGPACGTRRSSCCEGDDGCTATGGVCCGMHQVPCERGHSSRSGDGAVGRSGWSEVWARQPSVLVRPPSDVRAAQGSASTQAGQQAPFSGLRQHTSSGGGARSSGGVASSDDAGTGGGGDERPSLDGRAGVRGGNSGGGTLRAAAAVVGDDGRAAQHSSPFLSYNLRAFDA